MKVYFGIFNLSQDFLADTYMYIYEVRKVFSKKTTFKASEMIHDQTLFCKTDIYNLIPNCLKAATFYTLVRRFCFDSKKLPIMVNKPINVQYTLMIGKCFV